MTKWTDPVRVKNINIPKMDRPSIETQVHNVDGYNKGKTSNLSKSTKWTDLQ